LHLLGTFLSLLPRTRHALAVLGNWEHWAKIDRKQLEGVYGRHGTRLLVNESVQLEHHGKAYVITGFDDATGGNPDVSSALQTAAPHRNHIVLAHSPNYRDHIASRVLFGDYQPQAVLSGHTHGGQVQVLGWAPVRPPGSGRYVSGWYKESEPHLFVSRGIGTSVFPVRFGASPELPFFEWYLH
jgi:predicted MPP superfamily phosphohydrolase